MLGIAALGLGTGLTCLRRARRRWTVAITGAVGLVVTSPLATPAWTAYTFGLIALSDLDTAEGVSGTAAVLSRDSHGLVYLGNYGTARSAILAALASVFPVVIEHAEAATTFTALSPLRLQPARVVEVLTPRAPRLELGPHPPVSCFFDGLRPVSPGGTPMRDDYLVYKYQLDPVSAWWR